METAPLRLVIRFSDTMFEVSDVVSLHNQIVDEHGAVWFGKLGGTLSLSRPVTKSLGCVKNILLICNKAG